MPLSKVRRLGVRYQKLREVREQLNQAIREARDEGETYDALAEASGLSAMTVFNVVNGRKYR